MCGIAGIISLTGKPVSNANTRINLMLGLLSNRGPDSSGKFISDDGLVVIGNSRLAIVDVNNDFKVPFVSQKNNAVLAYNGETFNFHELRNDLKKKGINFRTMSDTEVVCEGISNEGDMFLQKMDGFWGLAFYHSDHKRVLLSRDLMGEKHIFYLEHQGEFIFASEMNPILSVMNGSKNIDFSSVISGISYSSAQPGRTLVEGVSRIEAGHTIEIMLDGRVSKKRTLNLHPQKWHDFFLKNPSEDEVIELYEHEIANACETRIPKEVNFFSTLSGGIDSNLVASFSSERFHTLNTLHGVSTMKSQPKNGDYLSEEKMAAKMALLYGSTHHSLNMIEDGSTITSLKYIADNAFDGMFDAGSASFNVLANYVRSSGSKVLILSDGPDELIGGYEVDYTQYFANDYRRKHPKLFELFRMMSTNKLSKRMLSQFIGKNFAIPDAYGLDKFQTRCVHQVAELASFRKIFDLDKFNIKYGTLNLAQDELLSKMDFSQKTALAYATTSLPDHFNLRSDKGIMSSSVEPRLPLQAKSLVELMLATPAKWRYGPEDFKNFKSDRYFGKYILRKVLEKRVGKVISNRNKYGFSAPLWKEPTIFEKLNMEDTIYDSGILEDLPFKKKLSRKLIGNSSYLWQFYSLARTYHRLKNNDFSR